MVRKTKLRPKRAEINYDRSPPKQAGSDIEYRRDFVVLGTFERATGPQRDPSKTNNKPTNRNRMKLVITTFAALAMASALAIAEDAQPAAKGDKPKRDAAEAFTKIDGNSDNALTLDEFKAGPLGKKDPAKAEEVFKKRDKDGDGKLSLEEFKAHAGGKKKDAK